MSHHTGPRIRRTSPQRARASSVVPVRAPHKRGLKEEALSEFTMAGQVRIINTNTGEIRTEPAYTLRELQSIINTRRIIPRKSPK